MRGDEIERIDTKLREKMDPKVRSRLGMILILKEGYKQVEVTGIIRTDPHPSSITKFKYFLTINHMIHAAPLQLFPSKPAR